MMKVCGYLFFPSVYFVPEVRRREVGDREAAEDDGKGEVSVFIIN